MGGDGAELLGLGLELFGRTGAFLGVGGGILGDLIELARAGVDHVDAAVLFERGLGDFGDEGIDPGGLGGDGGERIGHTLADLGAPGAFLYGVFDAFGRLLGRAGGALGEGAHLVGDDGKAGSGLAGAGGFDGGVEGEDVGLEGDFVDGADDGGDAGGGFLNSLHGFAHGGYFDRAGLGAGAGLAGEGLGGEGALAVAFGHAGDLGERGAVFLQRGGLVAGAFGEGLAGLGDLGDVFGENLRALVEFAGDGLQSAGGGGLETGTE